MSVLQLQVPRLARRRLCLSSFVVAGITALILWAAVADLLRQGAAALIGGHAAWIELRSTGQWPGWLLVPLTIVAIDLAASLFRDAIRLCPAMPQLHIETFRASIMIVASFGRYLPVSGHDHETARAGGAFWHCRWPGPVAHAPHAGVTAGKLAVSATAGSPAL